MYSKMPRVAIEKIWLRRTALVELHSSTNKRLAAFFSMVNRLQYRLYLRKYWNYDSYIIVLRKLADPE